MSEVATMYDLKVDRVKQYLTNRYPYLFIDMATEICPGVYAKGYKNLTANEWFFPAHFPNDPVVPGTVQMEAMVQMLSLTVLTLDGNAGLCVWITSANRVRLKRSITPGCRLDIDARLVFWDGCNGTGTVEGKVDDEEVCSADFSFQVIRHKDEFGKGVKHEHNK